MEKIIFHTSVCFGNCPIYHLQVNKDKSLLLYKELSSSDCHPASAKDSLKSGYYTGVASDSSFNKLTKELQALGLDTLNFNGATCCDGSLKTIIVYYNGKRKLLKSMFPPQSANKLIGTLYEICETSTLQKSAKKFEVENDVPKE